MYETAIQLEMPSQMPEWVLVVVVVEVGIASEHLLDDAFDVVVKVLVETRAPPNPIVRQLVHRLI